MDYLLKIITNPTMRILILLAFFAWAECEKCSCGWKNSGNERILGGRNAKINEFPMLVGLKGIGHYGPFCGGVILTKRHVLTAAHCVHDHKGKPMVVMVGAHDISKKDSIQEINVLKMISHPDYDKEGHLEKDIALLYLEKDIIFSKKVGPACMPTQKYDLVRKKVEIAGWGLTQDNGSHSDVLKTVVLDVLPLPTCEKAFPGDIPLGRGKTCHICTFTPDKDSCPGDSGGPVFWEDPEIKALRLVGIISYGGDCGSSPGINTEVFVYNDWIQEQIKATDKSQSTCEGK